MATNVVSRFAYAKRKECDMCSLVFRRIDVRILQFIVLMFTCFLFHNKACKLRESKNKSPCRNDGGSIYFYGMISQD